MSGVERIELWVFFNLFVLLLLALDLGVLHRHAKAVSLKEAAWWSAIWIVVALAFNAAMLLWYPPHEPALRHAKALEFFTGYLIERSLSIDNIFVFLVLFNYFGVQARFQYRVLFWGILGALIMRGLMIWLGVELITRFEWVLYLFGAFLVWTGVKLLFHKAEDIHPEQNPVLRLARRYLPVTRDFHGEHFFIREGGKWLATPMFLVLLVVETTDVAFALDSIPAIFAITQDPFIIYSSNVFAILGLRALYFLLAGVMPYFRYLNVGLSAVLVFIGIKMLIEKWLHIPTGISLGIVGGVLAAATLASVIAARREEAPGQQPAAGAAPPQPAPDVHEISGLIAELYGPHASARELAALELYRVGTAVGDSATNAWRNDDEFSALITDEPTVGIAVQPEHFERIRKAFGSPRLAAVPPDVNAAEFELEVHTSGTRVKLDILRPGEASPEGAITKFLARFGEGIQQVEYFVSDVDRATEIIRERHGAKPVFPQSRAGADNTRVNFFLVDTPDGKKALIELVQS